MKFQEIIFDLDGTLWNNTEVTTRALNIAMREVFGSMAKNFTTQDLAKTMGMNHNEVRKHLFPGLKDHKAEEVMKRLYELEIELLYSYGGGFYDGVIEGLQKASQKHLLFIVSNCQSDYLQAFYDLSKLEPHFQGALCYGDTNQDKVHNLLSIRNDYQMRSPVYVGDTQKDAEAAQKAKMPLLFAAYGFGKAQSFWKKAQNFQEVLKILEV